MRALVRGAIVGMVARALAFAPLLALGCRDTSPAVTAANVTRDVGHASAAALARVCTDPYLAAADLAPDLAAAEVVRLDRLGCVRAALAHDALRAAHGVLVSTVAAIDAGECSRVVTAPRSCDLAGAIRDVIRASADMALAVRNIERGEQ